MRSLILIFVFTLFFSDEIKALNIFELAIISGGTYFVYDQYFDQSLSYENVYQKKINVLRKHNQTLMKQRFIDLSSRLLIKVDKLSRNCIKVFIEEIIFDLS